MENPQSSKIETAVFGGGCFWCLETVFRHTKGVVSAVSGYAGGTAPNPSYETVCSGETGHAEVVRITFDPAAVSYGELLDIFFFVHDPTTPNRQGNDVGTQYRSIIVAEDEAQLQAARKKVEELASKYEDPIVTEIVSDRPFYPAEEYHQNYFEKNPDQAYCRLVIAPKLAKFRQDHEESYL
jgi:peptide-methionine (S)-S-oxide reductase